MSAPTLGRIDIELSLSTTIIRVPRCPAWFIASKAMPAVIEPSPITATTWCFSPRWSRASARPSAAEIEVEAWPAATTSYSLSARRQKPESPPYCRIVFIRSRRPVRILWG